MGALDVMNRLEETPGADERSARSAYLMWLLGLPQGVRPCDAARGALDRMPHGPRSIAGQSFAACLEQTLHLPAMPTRSRRRARN